MASRLAFRATKPAQSTGLVIMTVGLGFMAVGSKYIARAIQAGKKAAAEQRGEQPSASTGADAAAAGGAASATSSTAGSSGLFSKRYYEGGFEAPMSKREAALILGCRESSSKEKIMDRYRTLIRLNHPDLGGSPLVSAKINEAKNMLFTQARSDPNHVKARAKPAASEDK